MSHPRICSIYVRVLTISLYYFVLKIKCHKTHLSKRSRTSDNVFPLLQLLYASHFPHDLICCFSLASLMNILLYNTRILRKLKRGRQMNSGENYRMMTAGGNSKYSRVIQLLNWLAKDKLSILTFHLPFFFFKGTLDFSNPSS